MTVFTVDSGGSACVGKVMVPRTPQPRMIPADGTLVTRVVGVPRAVLAVVVTVMVARPPNGNRASTTYVAAGSRCEGIVKVIVPADAPAVTNASCDPDAQVASAVTVFPLVRYGRSGGGKPAPSLGAVETRHGPSCVADGEATWIEPDVDTEPPTSM